MVTNNELQPTDPITPDAAAHEIDKTLRRLLTQAANAGDAKAAARLQRTRQLMRALWQSMVAALDAAVQQRDELAAELADLTNALEHSITYHPRLEKLVGDIRDEIQDATLDYADEQQQLRAADFLHQELELPYPVAKAYAGEIIELLYNDTAPTGEQREALQALCNTLELPYWIGKASPDADDPTE